MNVATKAGLLANMESYEYEQFEEPGDTLARGIDRWIDESAFVARSCGLDNLPGIPEPLFGLENEVRQTGELDAVIYCRFTGRELGVVMRAAHIEDYHRSAAMGVIRRYAGEEGIVYAEIGLECRTEEAIADCLTAQGEWPTNRNGSNSIYCLECKHCGAPLEVSYSCDAAGAKVKFWFQCSSDCERTDKRDFCEAEVEAMLDEYLSHNCRVLRV